MMYVTFKLACNPMFFRQAQFFIPLTHHNMKITCAAFIFPGVYVISDAIIALTSRKIGFIIITFGIICDGLFSYGVNYFASLGLPTVMSKTELANSLAVNVVGIQMWPLYYHGVIATSVAALSEALIFSFVYKKIKSFFISTISSITIILVIHNLITDYPMLKHEPDVWHIIINNWLMNISFMTIYTLIIILGIKIRKNLKHNRFK